MNADAERAIQDLVDAISIESFNREKILRDEINEWRRLYINAIDNPCQHQRTEILKGDSSVSLVCKCCGLEVGRADSAEQMAGGAYLIKPLEVDNEK